MLAIAKTADNDTNCAQGRVQLITVPQFTGSSNWYLLDGPSQIELIEARLSAFSKAHTS
jgi:hypothetical protein